MNNIESKKLNVKTKCNSFPSFKLFWKANDVTWTHSCKELLNFHHILDCKAISNQATVKKGDLPFTWQKNKVPSDTNTTLGGSTYQRWKLGRFSHQSFPEFENATSWRDTIECNSHINSATRTQSWGFIKTGIHESPLAEAKVQKPRAFPKVIKTQVWPRKQIRVAMNEVIENRCQRIYSGKRQLQLHCCFEHGKSSVLHPGFQKFLQHQAYGFQFLILHRLECVLA